MKKLFLVFAASSLMLASCDKDQKTTNKLAGEWEIVDFDISGEEYNSSDVDGSMEFDDCKTNKEECTGKHELEITFDYGSYEYTQELDFDLRYSVNQGGDKMFLTLIDEDGYETTLETEITLEKDDLEIKHDDGDGFMMEWKLERK